MCGEAFLYPLRDIAGRVSNFSSAAGITPSYELLRTAAAFRRYLGYQPIEMIVHPQCSSGTKFKVASPVMLEKLDSHKLFSDDMPDIASTI